MLHLTLLEGRGDELLKLIHELLHATPVAALITLSKKGVAVLLNKALKLSFVVLWVVILDELVE